MSEYPRDRYAVWREHWKPDARPWADLSMTEQGQWVTEIEPEHLRKIREQTNRDFTRAPYWIGGIALFLGTCWLLHFLRVVGW